MGGGREESGTGARRGWRWQGGRGEEKCEGESAACHLREVANVGVLQRRRGVEPRAGVELEQLSDEIERLQAC